ncbi:MATE family efflux transporter [Galactobacter valiniphilus]|uniref:MATE family efflux transporter n=1 Tax=Galactobacter valiniphilus TaxID=2676122 RepID=UPI003737006D
MSTDHRSVLSSAPLWRALIHLCVPMMAGFIVGAVYNIINAGFIGTLHSTALLAALTFSLPVFALIMAVGGVFGVGGGTLMSRLMGSEEAGDAPATEARIRAVSSFTFWGALTAGAVLAVVGVLFATPIAQAVGASGETLAPTALYIALMFGFCPVYVACFALEQVVRAEGAAVASMTGLIASTVANLAFDVLFILVLSWGVAGAGLALGLSNVVMAGYYLWWITKRSRHASVSPRDLRVDGPMVREVMGVGASELLQSSFLIVTTLVMNWVAVGYGAALLAAMGVTLRIAQLPEMIGMGVFMGIIPLLAYAHGADNVERLRRAVLASAAAILGIAAVFSGVVFLFRDGVFALFSADPAVIEDGTKILTAMLVATLFNGLTGLAIALFQATGQMRNAAILAVAQGVLFIPVVFGARALWGFDGVVWAMTITEALCLAAALMLLWAARSVLAVSAVQEGAPEAPLTDGGVPAVMPDGASEPSAPASR